MDRLDNGTILYEQDSPPGEPGGGLLRIVQIPEDGGESLVVFWPEIDAGTPIWVHGLPDARGALVVTCIAAPCPNASLHAVDLRDLSSEVILEGVLRAWYTPTGHLVYVRNDGALFAAPFDLGALEITGGAIPLFDGVRLNGAAADIRLSAEGTLLYVESPLSLGSPGQQLAVVDLEGNEETLALAPRPIPNVGVGGSPGGESVVFSSEGQIYTYNVTLGTTPRQLTFEGTNTRPVFSPDGDQVAFSSIREGTAARDLFVKNLNDDSPPRSIITLDADQFVTQWPSDTLIVFEVGAGVRDLWMVNLSDPDNPSAEVYLSSEADLRRVVVSPDGSLAAYRSNESGVNEIYIRSFPDPGERTVVSQGGGSAPNWSPDGNTLYYTPGQPFMAARLQLDPVPVVLSTDTLFALSGGGTEPFPGSALHPDGDRFIFARTVTAATVSEGGASEPDRLILVQNFFEELRQVVPE